jgi:membrane protease YdiL (CAAX protease family)
MEPTIDVNQSITDVTGSVSRRVSREQFLHLGGWFTFILWLAALLLPWALGRAGVWPALDLAGLVSAETAWGMVLGLASGAAALVSMARWRPWREMAARLSSLVDWETFGTADYVLVALLAACGEEPLFRGVLQPWIGLLPTAALFGLLHATCAAHVVLAGGLGLLLGWLYQWSGSLWPPIAAHLVIDVMSSLFLARAVRREPVSVEGGV